MVSFQRVGGILLLCLAGLSPAFGTTISFLNAQGTPFDTVNWSQLGTDQVLVNQIFSATSAGNVAISGSFADSGGGLLSVVGTSWPSSTGYNTGDTLLWAENQNFAGSSPITLTFAAQGGVGAYVQSTSSGQFSAILQVFNGNTLLGMETLTSDLFGDPIFLGALSDQANITKVTFGGATCGFFDCDPKDLSINKLNLYQASAPAVPEPSTLLLAGSFLGLMSLARRGWKPTSGRKVQ